MNEKSIEYWQKREKKWQEECQKEDQQWQKDLMKVYEELGAEIQEEIERFLLRYASAEGVDMRTAQQMLDSTDMKHYAALAKKYCTQAAKDMENGTYAQDDSKEYFTEQANAEMRRYNARMKISRLRMLESQLSLKILAAQSKTNAIVETAAQKRAMEEFTRQAGILGNTVLDNMDDVDTLIHASFHGATFSDRIWGPHQEQLQKKLQKALRNSLILGQGLQPFVRELHKELGVTKRQAARLLGTELTRVQVQANLLSIKESGFEEFTFIAAAGCCKDCQEANGEHYKVDDAKDGLNLPPVHPNCRCTIAPYMGREDDDDGFDEAAFDEWSESYEEHGLSWEEWKKQQSNPQPENVKEYTADDIPKLEAEVKKFEEWMITGGDYDVEKGLKASRELEKLRAAIKLKTPGWSVIPDFQRMRREEIESWISQNVQTKFGSTKGTTKEVLAETVKAIRLVEERVGGPVPGVDSVEFGLGKMHGHAAAYYNERTRKLALPARPKGGLARFEALRKAWAYETDPPAIATTTYIGDVLHEIGHAVDISTGRSLQKKFFVGSEPRDRNAEGIFRISKYASELSRVLGREEAIAESFSAWLDPNKERTRYVPFQVGKAIDQLLDDIKSGKVKEAKPPSNSNKILAVKKPLEGQPAKKALEQTFKKVEPSLSDYEKRILKKYTKNDGDKKPYRFFEVVNRSLRGMKRKNDPDYSKQAETLQKLLLKTQIPEDMVVYRTMQDDPFKEKRKGSVVTLNGFTSTSLSGKATLKYPVKMEILVKKGTPGLFLKELSKYPNQEEVLLAHGLKATIVERASKDGKVNYTLIVGPDKEDTDE